MKSILVVVTTLVICGELILRNIVGLGSPPLYVTHPTIEYMLKPNQDVSRFGNHIFVNEYSMRSASIEEIGDIPRTLVLGDSVINGGNQTSHSALATSILSDNNRFYGNVSAGSWGPKNLLAWLNEYGFLKADTLIFVLNSHDLTDIPTFQELNKNTHPTKKPLTATTELIERYLIPRLLRIVNKRGSDARLQINTASSDTDEGAGGINDLIAMAKKGYVKVCLVQHVTQTELDKGLDPNFFVLKDIFEGWGLPVINDFEDLQSLIQTNEMPFRDDIHPNLLGQQVLARKISECQVLAKLPQIENIIKLEKIDG
ncbi:hypothetical protein [Hirschia litorea]|uniref:SGNH hydrolase-type esterase domain-containing protein n=1 Tax=Hirschia litorea TaxID=1199156 RepID=A0ABW2IPF4_9PROT